MKSILEKIKKQENQIRNLLANKKHREHLKICSCLDVLGNSILAIDDYYLSGIGNKEGGQYLKLYGLAQTINNMHQIILKFYKIIGLNIGHQESFKDIQKFLHYTLEVILDIDNEITFSPRTITDEVFEITSTILNPERKEIGDTINYKEIISKYLEEYYINLSVFVDYLNFSEGTI